MKELSFKSRLGIFLGTAFSILFLLGILLFISQYRLMGEMSRVDDLLGLQSEDLFVIRALVSKIVFDSSGDRAVQSEMRNLGQYLKRRQNLVENPELRALYLDFNIEFEKEFLAQGRLKKNSQLQERKSLVSKTEEFIGKVFNTTLALSEEGHQKQTINFRWASAYLAFLALVGLGLGLILLRVIIRPLKRLATFVDQLNLEDELPEAVPILAPAIPEVISVARSFNRLLDRLQGYRALKIKRILVEKKRVEWIADSISDGVCLLRDDEIIYANPVAKKILAYGSFPQGSNSLAGISAVPSCLRQELPSGEWGASSLGASALLDAISLTMPVEFSIQDEVEGDRHFLIHAGILPMEMDQKTEPQTLVVAQDVTLVRESQEAKGHFLGTLSHELKTPVTSLTMAIHLLERMVSRSEKQDDQKMISSAAISGLVKTCVEEVDRLRKLLDEFLTISRLDILGRKVESQRIDFIKLVRNSVQGFQTTALARGIFLNFEVHSKVRQAWLSVDPSKLAWALSNLLTNAIRHTPKGGLVVARLEVFLDRVEVRVRDTGAGIEPRKRKNIFEKFSPYYDIRVARTGSTGAGLSIAREIISAHGGQIWVSSVSANGAEFCFTLPLQNKRVSSEEKLKGEISGTSACGG